MGKISFWKTDPVVEQGTLQYNYFFLDYKISTVYSEDYSGETRAISFGKKLRGK